MPVEQLLDDMCRDALIVRYEDGSYAPTNYAIETGTLVFVDDDDDDDDDDNDTGGALTGWDIDIDII